MTVDFLKGHRYSDYANEVFQYDRNKIEELEVDSDGFKRIIGLFINRHTSYQVPRLTELKRYYLHDNNIHYRKGKRNPRLADNRIASAYPQYITTFMQGYILGNPVKYNNDNKKLLEAIEEFNNRNHVDYHDSLIETDLSIYGRAYEITVYDENGDERVIKLQPETTFVVYDDTVDPQPLFGVRYYSLTLGDEVTYYVEAYTADEYVKFNTKSENYQSLELVEKDTHIFGGVPINEYKNNDDRLGDFENVLDNIDAYDLAQSELANFQQDSNDALLVIKGQPYTGTETPDYKTDDEGNLIRDENGDLIPVENSEADQLNKMLDANILILDDNPNPDGAQPDAQWLVKQFDSEGSEQYKRRIVDDILRFTFTPDTNDQNFAGTQSGEAMKYKLLGNDNLRKVKERLLTSGFLRRLKLIATALSTKNKLSDKDVESINDTNVVFTPNLPEDKQLQIDMATAIHNIASDETTLGMLSDVTGVDAKTELKRIEKEGKDEAQKYGQYPSGMNPFDQKAEQKNTPDDVGEDDGED